MPLTTQTEDQQGADGAGECRVCGRWMRLSPKSGGVLKHNAPGKGRCEGTMHWPVGREEPGMPVLHCYIDASTLRPGGLSIRLNEGDRTSTKFVNALTSAGFKVGDHVVLRKARP